MNGDKPAPPFGGGKPDRSHRAASAVQQHRETAQSLVLQHRPAPYLAWLICSSSHDLPTKAGCSLRPAKALLATLPTPSAASISTSTPKQSPRQLAVFGCCRTCACHVSQPEGNAAVAGRARRQAGGGAPRGQAARGEARGAALPPAGGCEGCWHRPEVRLRSRSHHSVCRLSLSRHHWIGLSRDAQKKGYARFAE